jgi:DnaJ like chaperone protein
MGAALGHAADEGALGQFRSFLPQTSLLGPARIAALLGRRDQLFAIGVVALSAKLAKCDGAVNRLEIDAFKRHFRIPPGAARDIGRLFDQARDTAEGFEEYADQLGEAFEDNRGMLEDVLAALFAIARADGPVNRREHDFLLRVCHGLGLGRSAWEQVSQGGAARASYGAVEDAYAVLGVSRSASDEEVRAVWKRLMRENHPDSLAARGVPPEFIARATDKVARINAAWDRIKRERRL